MTKRKGTSKKLTLAAFSLVLVLLCGLLAVFLQSGDDPESDDLGGEERDRRPGPGAAPGRAASPRLGSTPPGSGRTSPPAPVPSAAAPAPVARTSGTEQPGNPGQGSSADTSSRASGSSLGEASEARGQLSHRTRIQQLTKDLAQAKRTGSWSKEKTAYMEHELKELKEVVAAERKDENTK